ncbi:MAG: hypothetical protein GY854_20375 [Deltaproteobacteria bacterium]|nr:hypothetical protein [Deltaproteobacteria bacterium]
MSGKTPIWRWRLFIGWLAVSTVAGVVGCLSPLMKTLGYEYSLLISLVASLGAGQLAACYPHRVRNQLARFPGARLPALVLYRRALGTGLILAGVPLLFALINRVRVPPCNEIEGLAFFALMPICSVAISSAAGLLAGVVTPGAKTASALFFVIFAAGLFQALHSFHATPAVYLFGPFFGYFPGVLYDELVRVEGRFVIYRAATLLQIAAIIGALNWLLDPASLYLSFKRTFSRFKSGLVPAVFIIAVAAMHLAGPSLGHRTERSGLEDLLAQKIDTKRLELFFPPGTDSALVENLTDDAMFSLDQVEKYLGITASARISVFFFASRAQKAAAMGASGTNVAKPWRREVYITLDSPPHAILRHELAHAVAADLGSGPFAVPGSFGGLWPDPGRIEGLATAAQGPRSDLTVHQWAAAMKQLGLLKPLDNIFGLGFFNVAASVAYTAAGSFSSFVHDNFGADALNKAYQTGDWSGADGKSLGELEKNWLAFLKQIPLRDEDLAVARHRFDRPAVIHSVCVHEVAKLRAEAERLASMGAWENAFETYRAAHERSGRSTATRLQAFYALANSGKTDAIQSQAKELLTDPSVGSVNNVAIGEILADIDLAAGRVSIARRAFLDLALRARNEADRRRLEVKIHLVDLPENMRGRLPDILAVRPGPRAVSGVLAALSIAESVRIRPDDPILVYLLARQHFSQRDFDQAIALFTQAEQLGLAQTTNSIWLAARMLRARSLFHLGRYKEASAHFKAMADDTSLRLGAREQARDWQQRCVFQQKRREPII